jgi:hypothetical protein
MLRTGGETRDEAVDGGNLQPSNGADDVRAWSAHLESRREPAGQVRRLARLDQERLHVVQANVEAGKRPVEDHEVRPGKSRGDRRQAIGVIEVDDHGVVALCREQRQRPDRILAGIGRDDPAAHSSHAQRLLKRWAEEVVGAVVRNQDNTRARCPRRS